MSDDVPLTNDRTETTSSELTSAPDELSRVIGRIRDDQLGLRRALSNEQAAAAELRSTVERLQGERALVDKRVERHVATIERLTNSLREQEQYYQVALGERDVEIEDLRRRSDEVGAEWSVRFRRLATSHEREIDRAEAELAVVNREIETMRAELRVLRTRGGTAQVIDDGFGHADTHYVIDGDAVVRSIWPGYPVNQASSALVAVLNEHGRLTGARSDILFTDSNGLDLAAVDQRLIRVRVPRPELDFNAVLAKVDEHHRTRHPTLLVTDRGEFGQSVAPKRFARRLGLERPTESASNGAETPAGGNGGSGNGRSPASNPPSGSNPSSASGSAVAPPSPRRTVRSRS